MRRVFVRKQQQKALEWDEEATFRRALERLATAQKEMKAAWSIVQDYDRGTDRLFNKAMASLASIKAYLKKRLRGGPKG
jgi:hypothetical protein